MDNFPMTPLEPADRQRLISFIEEYAPFGEAEAQHQIAILDLLRTCATPLDRQNYQGFSEKPRASTDRGGIGATIEGFDAPKSPYRRTILRFSLYNVRHGKGFQLPLLPIC